MGEPRGARSRGFDWACDGRETAETNWNGMSKWVILYWTDSEVAYLLWTYDPAVSPKT